MLRSVNVEFPVEGDPTKLHTLDGMTGFVGAVWRVECMACGYRSSPYTRPAEGRKQAVRHANGASHGVRLRRALASREQEDTK